MEKDFESRKKDYLNLLRNNFEIFEMMKFNEANPEVALRTKEIILDPKKEELLFAEFTLDYVKKENLKIYQEKEVYSKYYCLHNS